MLWGSAPTIYLARFKRMTRYMRLLSLTVSMLMVLSACGSRTPSSSTRSSSSTSNSSARFAASPSASPSSSSSPTTNPSPSASPSDSGEVSSQSSNSSGLTFESLSTGQSRIKTAANRTAATQDEFDTLWEEHAGADKQPPQVDFTKQTVLAVFAGPKKSGGYSIKVTSVKLSGKELQVRYHLTEPEKGKLTSQVLTYPSHIVKIDRRKASGDFDSVKFIAD